MRQQKRNIETTFICLIFIFLIGIQIDLIVQENFLNTSCRLYNFFFYPSCIATKKSISIDNFKDCIIFRKVLFNEVDHQNLSVHYHQPQFKDVNTVVFYTSCMVREIHTLYHLKNVYICAHNAVATENMKIYVWNHPHMKNEYFYETSSECYDNVVYPIGPWNYVFGHFIHDALTSLLNIPKDILNKSKILLQFNNEQAFQFIVALGIPNHQFITEKNKYIYCKNLYMCLAAEPFDGFLIITFKKLRSILRNYFKVDEIKSQKYGFINRYKKRKILNFEELLNSTKLELPKYNWEIISLVFEKVELCAKTIASLIIWVSPCGSSISNSIFMHDGTGIVLIMGKTIDMPNYGVVYISNIFVIGFNNNFYHHIEKGGNVNITLCIEIIKLLLYAVENHSWPLNPNLFHPVNISLIRNRMKNIYNIYHTEYHYIHNIYIC